jgi:hypothetical protein
MSKMTIDILGGKAWRNAAGQYHRQVGPAIEAYSGSKGWCVDGKRHRLDGPAIEYFNGTKAWYVNDERHRLDGPAIESVYGSNMWFVEGVQYFNFKDFQKAGNLSDDQMTILRLKYGEINGY